MLEMEVGYLYKKYYVDFNNEKIEVFEFLDYVAAITFTNTKNNDRCNIINGKYAGFYASIMNKNKNDEDYVFLKDDLIEAVRNADNNVNIDEIKSKRISSLSKYYLRDATGTGLSTIVNKELISFLENNQKEKSDFDEEELDTETDIASMYTSIKETIISQDEQIMQILTALFKNKKVVESDLDMDLIAKLKENILICGSTGTGKTEILKRIAKLYNIPIVIEDATSLSETGYQGRKITDLLEDLFLEANGNIELAQKGILILDEFDKLAEKDNSGHTHVSRSGVQRSLLKLLDGHLFYFDDKKFDTSKLTIVGVGAFTGIINGDDYKNLTTDDFMKYGIMRELIGRFSKVITMNPLKKDDIIKILKNSNYSPISTYKKLFELLNVKFEFNDEFIEYIAELAIKKQSGARSLKTVFDECISSALFRIFAGEYSGISLVKPSNEYEKPYLLTKTKEKKGLFKR